MMHASEPLFNLVLVAGFLLATIFALEAIVLAAFAHASLRNRGYSIRRAILQAAVACLTGSIPGLLTAVALVITAPPAMNALSPGLIVLSCTFGMAATSTIAWLTAMGASELSSSPAPDAPRIR